MFYEKCSCFLNLGYVWFLFLNIVLEKLENIVLMFYEILNLVFFVI